MDYYNTYVHRLNQYGSDYQSRIQTRRINEFHKYLEKTVYKIRFNYNGDEIFGSFEKYKQDDTETLHYLLTDLRVKIPNGTILFLPDPEKILRPWMVFYLEKIQASGYNKYIMLRMTHQLSWTGRDNEIHTSWAYMYGQEDNMLKDEIKSRSRMDTIYSENLKSSFFVMPRNQYLLKDSYLVIGEEPFQEYYRVTGYDWQSNEGVGYVTIDPIYKYDLTDPPEQDSSDDPSLYFWLNGGSDVGGNND